MGWLVPGRRSQKIHKIIFNKTIDKSMLLWYNINVRKRGNTYGKSKNLV